MGSWARLRGDFDFADGPTLQEVIADREVFPNRGIPSQGQRPHAGINEQVHRRDRWAL